jgi:hypothetical protein
MGTPLQAARAARMVSPNRCETQRFCVGKIELSDLVTSIDADLCNIIFGQHIHEALN